MVTSVILEASSFLSFIICLKKVSQSSRFAVVVKRSTVDSTCDLAVSGRSQTKNNESIDFDQSTHSQIQSCESEKIKKDVVEKIPNLVSEQTEPDQNLTVALVTYSSLDDGSIDTLISLSLIIAKFGLASANMPEQLLTTNVNRYCFKSLETTSWLSVPEFNSYKKG